MTNAEKIVLLEEAWELEEGTLKEETIQNLNKSVYIHK